MRQQQYTMMTKLTERECYPCTGVRCKHSDRKTQLHKQLNLNSMNQNMFYTLTINKQSPEMFSICLLVLSLKYLLAELFILLPLNAFESQEKKRFLDDKELEIKILLANSG